MLMHWVAESRWHKKVSLEQKLRACKQEQILQQNPFDPAFMKPVFCIIAAFRADWEFLSADGQYFMLIFFRFLS